MGTSIDIDQFDGKPLFARLRGYVRLTGPGYLQSAMTLGGGSIASCVAMGSLLGYELLWVQPVGMLLGYFFLASVAKQTCHTEERPYDAFWNRLHPAFALLWGASAFIATIIWHIPQYSLTANGVVTLAEGAGVVADTDVFRMGIGAVVLFVASYVVYLYNSGASGLKLYEFSVKVLVWLIVASFAIVVFSTGVDFGRLFTGLTGIAFIQDLMDGGIDERAVAPIVGGIAAAVGINMVFLYPYSLLNKKWGPKYKELAYFDLITGMALPFLLATALMILAVANTVGPKPGEAGAGGISDIRDIIPVLAPTLGDNVALLLIGLGMTAIGFSTVITHMLACGFIGCEMFGLHEKPMARWLFSLAPGIGVVGVVLKAPIPLAISASTLAAPFMPIAALCFLILLNREDYMGEAKPRGGWAIVWNLMLTLVILALSVNAYFALKSNWGKFQEWRAPEAAEAALHHPDALVVEWLEPRRSAL